MRISDWSSDVCSSDLKSRQDEQIRFRDIVAQPRRTITSPTWSGIESERVSYNAGWTNVHELIPWRTLTGRQHFYQDHPWMLAFGEGFCVYKPPIDTKTIDRSEEHTSELQSLMRISYAVFCLKKKNKQPKQISTNNTKS